MRTLLAIAILVAGVFALDSTADAARKSKRTTKAPPHSFQPKVKAKVDVACEERARHEDPTGNFASYPCWAREAFARGRNINLH